MVDRRPDPVRPDVAIRPPRESPRSTARRGPSSSRPGSVSTGARDCSPREEQTRTLPERTTPAPQTQTYVEHPRTQRWIPGPSSQAAPVRRHGDDVRVHLCRTIHRVSSRVESCPNRRVPSGSRRVWQADCSRTIERGSSLLGSGVRRLPPRRQSLESSSGIGASGNVGVERAAAGTEGRCAASSGNRWASSLRSSLKAKEIAPAGRIQRL